MIARPDGYEHSDAFLDLALTLKHAWNALGFLSEVHYNSVIHNTPNIIFGAHLLSRERLSALPATSIIYNLEQCGTHYFTPEYLDLARRFWIWDYSPLNIQMWREVPGLRYEPQLVRVGYMPELRRIVPTATRDLDVLLYGSLSERRLHVIGQLKEAGKAAYALWSIYGRGLDNLIARSKIVLNIHYYPANLFEIVRVSYLLTNSKLVVTEPSPDIGDMAEAVVVAPYESLAEECLRLLDDEARRGEMERRGFGIFSQRSEVDILREAIRHAPFLID